jgi:hypothetical protein
MDGKPVEALIVGRLRTLLFLITAGLTFLTLLAGPRVGLTLWATTLALGSAIFWHLSAVTGNIRRLRALNSAAAILSSTTVFLGVALFWLSDTAKTFSWGSLPYCGLAVYLLCVSSGNIVTGTEIFYEQIFHNSNRGKNVTAASSRMCWWQTLSAFLFGVLAYYSLRYFVRYLN